MIADGQAAESGVVGGEETGRPGADDREVDVVRDEIG